MAGFGVRLADELGAYSLATLGDQAAIGLVGERGLRHAGDEQRVEQAGDDGERDKQRECRAKQAAWAGGRVVAGDTDRHTIFLVSDWGAVSLVGARLRSDLRRPTPCQSA